MNNPSSPSPEAKANRSARLWKSLLIPALAVACIAGLSLCGVPGGPQVGRGLLDRAPDPAEMEARIADARRRLQVLSSEYADAQQRDIAATRAEIERLRREAKAQIAARADTAARPFQGFGNVSKCVTYGARDKLTGSRRLETYATESLQPAASLLLDTHRKLLAALEALRQNSLARANDWHKESLALARAAGLDPVHLDLHPDVGAAIAQGAQDLVSLSNQATLATGLELIVIKTTYGMIHRTLQAVIAKAAKTAGFAGTAAVADGPFPVGDAIGAGIAVLGGAWTAWDIRKAVKANRQLPNKIETALQEQLDHLDQSAEQQAGDIARGFGAILQPDT